VVFSIGMYVVVFGLRNVGLTHWLGAATAGWPRAGLGPGILGTGLLVAALSSVMNNMPTVMVNVLAVHDAVGGGALRTALVYAECHWLRPRP
jgi:arsenical pump membrane protein